MRLLNDLILVKKLEDQASTLILPSGYEDREKPMRGVVIKVGPGVERDAGGNLIPPDVRFADVVLFHSFAGTELTIKGQEHRLIRPVDILVVFEEEDI